MTTRSPGPGSCTSAWTARTASQPESSASVSPEQADGKLGWYSEPPTVTLEATDRGGDGRTRSRVPDRRRRRADVRRRRSRSPATATTRSATARRTTPRSPTSSRPTCSACGSTGRRPRRASTSHGPRVHDGPVDVTLDPQDGAGSGAVLTQYRVDGGPWKAYAAEDEHIFDGTQALARPVDPRRRRRLRAARRRLGRHRADPERRPGHALVPGQGRTATSGSSWSSARAARTAGSPTAACSSASRIRGRRSPSGRSAAARGNAANAPEWVAIQCGHEIQLYDGQTGEERKTGSIYTFDNNDITRDRTRLAVRRVERLRDRGRRADLPRLPQRRADQGVRELAGQDVGPRGRSAGQPAPVRAGLHRPAEPRRGRPDGLPQHPRRGPLSGRAGCRPDRPVPRRGHRPAHDRGPLGRRRRQRRGEEGPRLRDRRGRAAVRRASRSRRCRR